MQTSGLNKIEDQFINYIVERVFLPSDVSDRRHPAWMFTSTTYADAREAYEKLRLDRHVGAASLILHTCEVSERHPLIKTGDYSMRNISRGAREQVLAHGSRPWMLDRRGRVLYTGPWVEGEAPSDVLKPGGGGGWGLHIEKELNLDNLGQIFTQDPYGSMGWQRAQNLQPQWALWDFKFNMDRYAARWATAASPQLYVGSAQQSEQVAEV